MGVVEKGLEIAAKAAGKAVDKHPVAKFAKETVLRDQTMKEALVAKFKFLKDDLLGPKRSKFEASSKTKMNDFLRRMIVENPEEIVNSYAEHLCGFGSDATKEDFEQFSMELGVMRGNVIRILGVIKKNPKTLNYIQPMEQFLGYLDVMISAANAFAVMSDEERKKALSGDKDGLTAGAMAALQRRDEVRLIKNKVFKKAQLKEDIMKATDREIIEALDEMYEKEMAKERALRAKLGKEKKAKVEEEDDSNDGKVLQFPKKKSAQNKHGKGGQAKSKKESFIEEMAEAA